VLGTFYFSIIWKSAKWASIRDKTQILSKDTAWWKRLNFYVKYKGLFSTRDSRLESHLKYVRKQEQGNQITQKVKAITNKFNKLNANILGKLKDKVNQYLPTITIWLLRLGLGLQAYMYHSSLGLFHIAFVLFTFLVSTRFALTIAVIIILPTYFVELITVYSMKIALFDEFPYIVFMKKFFLVEFKHPILEQALYFINQAVLFLSISCIKLCFMSDTFGNIASSHDAMV